MAFGKRSFARAEVLLRAEGHRKPTSGVFFIPKRRTMWSYTLTINNYEFKYISEWNGNILVGIEGDYDVSSPDFSVAFSEAMSEKRDVCEFMDFSEQTQGNSTHFARQFHGNTEQEWIDFLEGMKLNKYLDETKYLLISRELEIIYKKQEARNNAKITRKEFSRNYDSIFVAVGKRDGFFCAECRTTENLSLDHKFPVIRGGDNKLENFQLLCKSHNSSKGSKINV